MPHTVEGLERSRNVGFRPRGLFGLVLREFLNLGDGMRVIDLGCGSGFFTRIIAEQCKGEIVGVDVDHDLLDAARRLAKDAGLEIRFETGDITDIGYSDESFDLVMCDIMLERFLDIEVPLKEMQRVCRRGGTVAAIEPFYKAYVEYDPVADAETQDLLLKCMRIDRAFGLGPQLRHWFHMTGLVDVDMVTWFWGRIGYQAAEGMAQEERLRDLQENIEALNASSLRARDYRRTNGGRLSPSTRRDSNVSKRIQASCSPI